jgi:hypothetical protein
VTGTHAPFPPAGEVAGHDPGGRTGGIHRLGIGQEEEIDTALARQRAVTVPLLRQMLAERVLPESAA